MDPLGASIPDVLHTALMSCFLDADFVNFSQRVQFDGFHCGVWCVFLAEEYINFCHSDADPSCFRITNPLVKSDTVALEDHMENTRFIRRWRESFKKAWDIR